MLLDRLSTCLAQPEEVLFVVLVIIPLKDLIIGKDQGCNENVSLRAKRARDKQAKP